LEEIAVAENRLERIERLGKWVYEFLGITDREMNQVSLMSVYLPDPPLSTLWLTVLANQVLNGERVLRPIEAGDLGRLYARLIEKSEGEGPHEEALPEMRAILTREFGNRMGEENLDWWLDFLAVRVASSLGKISRGQDIDPRFIDIFLVKR
jgi:hypothetical protein